MKKFKPVYILLLLGLLTGSCSEKREPLPSNVVFILIDDLGWTDLGVMGSDLYRTPHVDRLAARGTLFTNAYSACTVCSPTRASLMTGKYPARINCTDWIKGYSLPWAKLKSPDWTMYMDTTELTLAELFRENGYTTAHIGKWHLGEDSLYWPENQGFDINIGGWAKGSPNRNSKRGTCNGYFPPFGNPRLKDNPDDKYLTMRLSEEACNFISENNPARTGKPFFLNFWLYSVHTPLQAMEDKVKKYRSLADTTKNHQNPVYAAMVEHMDDAVGRILEKLETEGLADNTMIVFTSDNGGLTGRRRAVTSNFPLRLGKGHMYEGGIRVPLIMFDPRVEKARKKCDVPVISCDFFPSLADMTELELNTALKTSFDGMSIAGLLSSETTIEESLPYKREALYWHYPHYHTEGASPYSAVRAGDWKLIRLFENDNYELYNLASDISESNNLIASEPGKADSLKTLLFEWYEEVGAQMPVKNEDYDPSKCNQRK